MSTSCRIKGTELENAPGTGAEDVSVVFEEIVGGDLGVVGVVGSSVHLGSNLIREDLGESVDVDLSSGRPGSFSFGDSEGRDVTVCTTHASVAVTGRSDVSMLTEGVVDDSDTGDPGRDETRNNKRGNQLEQSRRTCVARRPHILTVSVRCSGVE